jgi:hypothetical protein
MDDERRRYLSRCLNSLTGLGCTAGELWEMQERWTTELHIQENDELAVPRHQRAHTPQHTNGRGAIVIAKCHPRIQIQSPRRLDPKVGGSFNEKSHKERGSRDGRSLKFFRAFLAAFNCIGTTGRRFWLNLLRSSTPREELQSQIGTREPVARR